MPIWALALAGCTLQEPHSALDEGIAPAGPCWELSLSNGFDESSTAEITSFYHCLNQSGSFNALGGLVETFDVLDSSGIPIGIQISWILNRLEMWDLSIFKILDLAIETMLGHSQWADSFLNLVLELLYGADEPQNLLSPSAFESGLVGPSLRLLTPIATVLNSNPAAQEQIGAVLEGERLSATGCLLHSLPYDPAFDAFPADLHRLHLSFQDPTNDRWEDASGDSLYDFVHTLLAPSAGDARSPLQVMQADILDVLSVTAMHEDLAELLLEEAEMGRLQEIIPQVAYLATVDVKGRFATDNDHSALATMLRLMATTNQPLECDVEVLGFEVASLSVDNLAVNILGRLANTSPGNVRDAIDLIDILDWGISAFLLDEIIEREICPLLTETLLDDIESLERLDDPEARDLLISGLSFLRWLRNADPEKNHLDNFVNLLAALHHREMTGPLEELVKDIQEAEGHAATTAIEQLATIIDGVESDACGDITPLTFHSAIEATVWAMESQAESSPLDDLMPVVQTLLYREEIWVLLENLSELLGKTDGEVAGVLELWSEYREIDPDSEVWSGLRELYADDEMRLKTIALLQSDEFMDAIVFAELVTPGPMAFIGTLIANGGLLKTLRTIALFVQE
jgi:hypothetical protein